MMAVGETDCHNDSSRGSWDDGSRQEGWDDNSKMEHCDGNRTKTVMRWACICALCLKHIIWVGTTSRGMKRLIKESSCMCEAITGDLMGAS